MKRFFLRFFLFLAVIYLIAYVIFLKLERVFVNEHIICDKTTWLHKQKNGNYDFAVLGSSRVLNNVNNRLIDDSLKTHSINLATSGGGYAENYINLYLFTKQGNHVKRLLLQVDGGNLDMEKFFHRAFNEQYYVYLLNDEVVAGVVKDHVNHLKYYCWKVLPLSRFMEYNFRYSIYKAFKGGYTCSTLLEDEQRGFEPLVSDKAGLDSSEISTFHKKSKEVFYLNKIVAFCKEKNIELLLFTAPEYGPLIKKQPNRKEIDVFYDSVAKANRCVYINNNAFEPINNNLDYFYDIGHLNATGANAFSRALIPYIYPSTTKRYESENN